MSTMRVTMTRTTMGESGSLLTAGSTYTVSTAFGAYLVGQAKAATDPDGALSPLGSEPLRLATNPVTGAASVVDPAGNSVGALGNSIAFYGDSIVENGSNYLTPVTVPAQSFGAAFAVKGTEINCPAGAGTLTYSAGLRTLTWAAFGDSAGALTDASKTGMIYVPSATPGYGIYLDWFGGNRAYTSGSVSITAKIAALNLTQYKTNGFATTALAFAMQSLKLAPFADSQNGSEAMYGLGGGTSTELLSAMWQWSAINSEVAVLLIGTNDGANSYPAATTIAAIQAIAAGIKAPKVVICTIPPRTADGANQHKIKAQVNQWIFSYCAGSKKYFPFDLSAYVTDPATGDYLAAYSTDNVHPNGKGSMVAGQALGTLLTSLSQSTRPPIRPNFVGLFDATYNPYGALFVTAGMGTFEGTGGTAGTGASGTIPAGWRVRRTSGAAMTAVGSKVAYTDKPGSEWRVTLASAAASEVVTIDTGLGLSANIAAGDWVEASVTVNVVSCTLLNQISLNIYDNGTGIQVTGFANGDGVLNDFTGPLVIRIPKWQVPVGFTNLSFSIQIGNASGGAAVIGFRDIQFNKVNQTL